MGFDRIGWEWGHTDMVEWRQLDELQAVEDVRRFVDRARRGECATFPREEPDWVGEEPEWSGSAPSAASPPTWSQPPYWTAPTVRPVVRRPHASASAASFTRRSTVTVTRSEWATDSRIPPKSNEAVAQIMAEKGVNRRRAYAMLREQKAAEVDTSNVGQGQRIAVLTCLIARPEAGRDAPILLAALHDAGIKIDMHDTVKTLWALQKTQYIQFRERGGRSLYAIKITYAGLTWLAGLKPKGSEPPPETEPEWVAADRFEIDDLEAKPPAVTGQSSLLPAVMAAPITAPVDEGTFKLPWIKGNLGGWPSIRDVRDRALKAVKVNAAAKLLEEAGEDEIALTLLGKTDFTPLEEEIIHLLRIMGEIE